MIRWQPALMAVTALGLSGALHAAGLVRFAPAPVAVAQGGEAQAAPLLGDSFADLAEGIAQPVTASPVAALAPVAAALAPVAADPAPHAVPVAQIPALPQLAALAPLSPRNPVSRPTVEATRPVAPPVAQTTRPNDRLKPVEAPPETRPKARPEARAKPAALPPAPAGNATRTARKGTAQGTDTGKSTTAAAAASPAPGEGGSARAAASYGREVMARIARTARPRSTERGRAVVGFVIADSGAVTRVSILRSSGSASLDAQAMDHIRRAAPFAPPPTGAPRSLSVEFIGR
ncbi:MAG: energy transducer TonB [Pseudorhodobacter sp.]